MVLQLSAAIQSRCHCRWLIHQMSSALTHALATGICVTYNAFCTFQICARRCHLARSLSNSGMASQGSQWSCNTMMSGLGHLAMQESQAQPQLPLEEVLRFMAASGMKKGPLEHLKAQLLKKAAVEPLAPLAVKQDIEDDMAPPSALAQMSRQATSLRRSWEWPWPCR